ncbi:hypothetical protein [Nonomuraea recticatena]|uniref:Minor tail protein n=1 Tax=Nonomuraea recticatena TaxID=46178 RepID=A0ABN3S0M9_9ACTN
MTERSYPFDGGQGAAITEDDWSNLAGIWQDDGVIASGLSSPDLKVTSTGEANKIVVASGRAFIQGFAYHNSEPLVIPFTSNAHTTDARIDLIGLRLDRTNNRIEAFITEGTPAPTPAAPALNRTAPIYEVALATILVGPTSGTIPPGSPNVVDVREFIGRRTRVTSSLASVPAGTIAYNPADDTFYSVDVANGPVAFGSGGGGGEVPVEQVITHCTSTTRPAPVEGRHIYETDTNRTLVYADAAWVSVTRQNQHIATRNTSLSVPVSNSVVETFWDFPVGVANYVFSGVVFYNGAVGASSTLAISAPGLTVWGMEYHTGSNATLLRSTGGSGTALGGFGCPVASVRHFATFWGAITNLTGTAGKVTATYFGSATPANIMAGSHMKLERI